MKVIAISQRVDVHPGRRERRDALDQRLCTWVLAAGYLPVPVPNTLNSKTTIVEDNALFSWLQVLKPHAIILSGGNDIGEIAERDNTEYQLLTFAQTYAMPLLGICHGMQIMGTRAGVKLQVSPGHTCTRHVLTGDYSDDVNSYHNFALTECPQGYSITAKTQDGGIEAIRHQSLPWEGWMWHPEREPEFHPRDTQRLRQLFGE